MTCIVGLVQKGTVYIGADSASVSGWTSRVTRLPKVFRRGPFLIGYTTSFRMGQLLEHALAVPPQGDESDDMRFMVTTFVESVRALLKERGPRAPPPRGSGERSRSARTSTWGCRPPSR